LLNLRKDPDKELKLQCIIKCNVDIYNPERKPVSVGDRNLKRESLLLKEHRWYPE
jgi:hypothetical protein